MRRQLRLITMTVLVLLAPVTGGLLSYLPFHGASAQQDEPRLSAAARQQIMALLAEKQSRTPAQKRKPDPTAASGITTTVSRFTQFTGTSAAAAHAGAIAALLKAANPRLTPNRIRQALLNSPS